MEDFFIIMSSLTICIIASATGAYFIWGYQSIKKDLKPGEGPSFSSLLLWSIIDSIMWVNTARAHNNQTLIATYTIFTIALTLLLIIKKKWGWGKTDWLIAGIAFTCLVVSYLTPPVLGVLSGALSILAAGVPNLIKMSKVNRTNLSCLTMLFFFIGPFLSFFQVFLNKGEIKDYIYPFIAMTYWATAYFVSPRERFTKLIP